MSFTNVHDVRKSLPKKAKCKECTKPIKDHYDAFNFEGMYRDDFYCRKCYFKKLE